MDPDADLFEHGDRAADIHGVAAKAIKFGDDKNVPGFQFVHEAHESRAPCYRCAAGNCLRNNPARFDLEARRLNFVDLVFGGLTGGGDAHIGKGAGDDEQPGRRFDTKTLSKSRTLFINPSR